MSENDGKTMPIGSRVSINGKPELGLGTVKYCGMTKFSPGRWVGIELDIAAGKNDGTVQGERYFECKPAYGLFVKPNMAVVVEDVSAAATTDDGVDDSKLMPAPITTPSKLAPPSSTGIRPPSSTGIRPPSSLGKSRPSLTGAPPTTPTSTSSIKKPAETGIRRPSTIPSSSSTTTSSTTTTSTTTSPSSTSPSTTSPPPEKKTETIVVEQTPPIPSPPTTTTTTTTPVIIEQPIQPTPVIVDTPSPPPPTTTTTTTTTSSIETPSKIARPPSSTSTRPTGIPKPSGLKEPTTTAIPTTPSPPTTTTTTTTSPTSIKKQPTKIIQGEDDEEEEEINDLLNKSIATEKMNQVVQENIDKMMNTINELTESKIKAQDEINQLKDKLKETITTKDKQIKENEKQISQLEKTIVSKEKENENLLKTAHKNEDKEKNEFEKEKLSLLDQINNLNEQLELVTLDKELTEEKLEMTELEFEAVKEEMEFIKIEHDSLKIQLTEKPTRSIDENLPTDVLVLQEQNDKLKEALVKLRDITMNDKHELSKRNKEYEQLSKQFAIVSDKANKLDTELSLKIEEALELQLALEDAGDNETLITDLTDKNLSLSEELEELKMAIADLESFRDLSEELSENQAALEKSLRLEVNSKDIEILNLNGQLANLQIKNQENEKTILQFRDLVGRLQHKLEEMRRKEEEQSEQNTSWSAIQQQLLSKNIQLQNQVIKATALEIDHQLEQSKSVESQVHLAFVYEYLPEQTFSNDNDAIKMLLLLRRIILKSELSQKYLNRTYKVEEIGNKLAGGTGSAGDDDSSNLLTSSHVAHSLSIIHTLEHMAISATWLTETLERCSSEQWLRSGRSIKDMMNQERILDHLLNLIKQEQFGATYSSSELEKVCQRLDSILNNIFGDMDNSIFKPEWSILLNYILGIQYNIKQIMLNDIDISNSNGNGNLMFPHKEMSKVLSVCRKVIKNLLTKPYLTQSSIVRDLLKSSEQTCKSILLEIVSALPKIQQDSTSNQLNELLIKVQARSDLIIGITGTAGVGSNSNSGNNKNSEIDDDYIDQEELKLTSSLEKVFYRMNIQLSDVVETIIAGDLNISEKDKQAIVKTNPWVERANQLKQQLNEVGSLRDIIASKDQELLENLKTIKAKEAELVEEKRKEESFDKRIKILAKSETTISEKLTKEVKTREENDKTFRQALNQLRNEKNSLEHDIKITQQKLTATQQELQKAKNTPHSPMIANQELLRSVDDIQVLSLKKAIRFLRNENVKLKSQKSIKELYELNLIQNYRQQQAQPTSSPTSPTSTTTSTPPTLLEQQTKKQQIKFNEIVEYSKQVNHIMSSILESTASPKVLDLVNNNSSNSNNSGGSKIANEIEKQKLLFKQQERKVKQLQSKMTGFISNSSSQFGLNNYADANQSRMLKESIPHKIATISIPNSSGTASTPSSYTASLMMDKDIQEALNSKSPPIQLFTNSHTFKEIHQVFVK